MKHTTVKQFTALLLLAAGLAGCSEEAAHTGTPGDTRTPMTVSVSDEGYTAGNASAADTRVSENGYITIFTTGDRIGLYVVKADGSYVHENLPLTLTDAGSGKLAWQAPGGTKLYNEDPEAKYFAYYPYRQTLDGSVEAAADNAADFFAGVTTAWTPDTDQSTYEKYTAQDLMLGQGVVKDKQGDSKTIAFTLTHAMALVVMETPATEYALAGAPGYTWTVLPHNTKFEGFTPYSPSPGTYRLLVKPGQSGTGDLKGSYTNADGKQSEYAISQNDMAAAHYAYNKVDGGISSVTHTLQAGDFYLKDGSLVSKDTKLTSAQQADCIGIVFWVGDATAKDKTLKTDHPACTHGLVVALGEKESVEWQPNYVSVQNWLNSNKNGVFLSVLSGNGSADPLNNIQGYNNTKATEAFNAANADNTVTAVAEAVAYRTKVPAPQNSSDWHLPSAKELTLLCGKETSNIWTNGSGGTANRDLINAQLLPIGGAVQISKENYWSGTEFESDRAWYVNFSDGKVGYSSKRGASYRVRSVLAF